MPNESCRLRVGPATSKLELFLAEWPTRRDSLMRWLRSSLASPDVARAQDASCVCLDKGPGTGVGNLNPGI